MMRAAGADVLRAQRERLVDQAREPRGGLRQAHDIGAVFQPDFEQQHHRQVPQVDEAEHGHGRGGVRREVHLERPLGMAQVQLQRQRRHQQEGQRREQRQPVGGPHGLHLEDALQRGQDEGAGHQAGDVGVEHDEEAPLQLHLVGVHETVDAGYHRSPLSHRLIAPSRPGPCSRPWLRWPCTASGPRLCCCAGTRAPGPWGS